MCKLRLKVNFPQSEISNPRPKEDADEFFSLYQQEIDGLRRDRKQLEKIMKKKFGFVYEKEPEKAFGPNLGRLIHFLNEKSMESIIVNESEIIPDSDLSKGRD